MLNFIFTVQGESFAVPAPSVEAAHALLLEMLPEETATFLGIAAH